MEEEKFCTCRYMHDMEKRVEKGAIRLKIPMVDTYTAHPPVWFGDDEQLPPYKPMNQVGGYQKHRLYSLLTL